MDNPVEENPMAALAEERLRLERESLAIERERLAAARLHAEAAGRLDDRRHHPRLVSALAAVGALLAFALGFLAGESRAEDRLQRGRADRLREALQRLESMSADGNAATNARAHSVSVVVIQ